MNRLDRITAIMVQLQSRRVVKAQEISERFDISLRTVYRDLKSIENSGVPISGEAGIGYRLVEGYRLQPETFTREEAAALLTAEKLINQLTDKATKKNYADALFKIKATLRSSEKDYVEVVEDHIMVMENPWLPVKEHDQLHLHEILEAVALKEVLEIGYTSASGYNLRQVEPVGIFYLPRFWYLIAWCRLRKSYRHFRADRISFTRKTGLTFTGIHPSLQSFLGKVKKEESLHRIEVLVDKEVIRYFGEQKYYNGFVSEQDEGQKVRMVFLSASLRGFAKYFLLFGAHADIVQPAELIPVIREEIQQLSERLK